MPYLKGDVPSQLESYVPQVKIELHTYHIMYIYMIEGLRLLPPLSLEPARSLVALPQGGRAVDAGVISFSGLKVPCAPK